MLAQSLARLQVDDVAYGRPTAPVASRLWMIHRLDLSPTASVFKGTLTGED